jgi:site-specific DNA recombinase
VTFFSVTQQFNTTNSMGRLTLNILMSFAEFERETTAERTRDKIAATRRKGIWTGGRLVLGYDLVEKRLVVNEAEAERVREVFVLYEGIRSCGLVAEELRARGWTTKTWTKKNGVVEPGFAFTKSSVHSLLTNPLYLGKIRCGDELAKGAHAAIIDEETWTRAQARLRANAVNPKRLGWRPNRNGALLHGILRCSCGSSMTHHSTQKGGRRYSYYVCIRQQKEGAKACPKSRAPAGKLEAFVIEQIRSIGRDPSVLAATLAADREDREARRPEFEAEVRRLGHERGRIDTERKNVVEAIEKGGTSLVGRLTELDGQLADVAQRQQEARAQLLALDRGAVDPECLRSALQTLEPIWNELVPRERARVLALLLEGIEFDPISGDVEITFRRDGPRPLGEVAQ